MNGSFGEKDFLGNDDAVDMQEVFLDFLTTAKEVRAALGGKGYLLDEYVINLLESFCETRNEAGETLCPGFDEGMKHNGICRAAMEHRDFEKPDAFDLTAKAYIEAQSLPLKTPRPSGTFSHQYCAVCLAKWPRQREQWRQ